MLPPRKAILPGSLNGPGTRKLCQVPGFGSLTLTHTNAVQSCLQSTHSHFKRRLCSCKDPKTYRFSPAHYHPSTNHTSRNFHTSQSWYVGHFSNRHHPTQSWRLLSSWGKWGSGDEASKDRGNGDEQKQHNWYKDRQRKVKENLEYFEELKRRIDSDPFGMLFGRRLQELSPHKWRLSGDMWSARARDRVSQSTATTEKEHAEHVDTKLYGASKQDAETDQCYSGMAGIKHESSLNSSNVEYDFDPITMRKVLKRSLAQTSSNLTTSKNSDKSVTIPVKPFVMATSRGKSHDPAKPSVGNVSTRPLNGQPASSHLSTIPMSPADGNVKDGLMQEGFGAKPQAANAAAAALDAKLPQGLTELRSPRSKIENALDRHLRTQGSASERTPLTPLKSEYNPKKNKTEEVDLLRPSDVRAASGLRGKVPKETAAEQQERRRTLAADHENRVQVHERQFAEEIEAQEGNEKEINDASDKPSTSKQTFKDNLSALRSRLLSANTRRDRHESLQAVRMYVNATNAQPIAAKASEVRSTRDVKSPKIPTVQDLKAQPAEAQWPQPGEGDMASNVHEFASSNRWYKQKAPHAMEEPETKVVQAAKDRALVREIRSIYEDTYSAIDTKYRQSSKDISEERNAEQRSQLAGVTDKHSQPGIRLSASERQELLVESRNAKLQLTNNPPNLEGMAMIQRLFEELHETQSLTQAHKTQLEKIPTTGGFSNLLQSLNASEQRVLQTLKTAWDLLKKGTVSLSKYRDESSGKDSPLVIPESALGTGQLPETTQEAPADIYRIVAYDPYTQKVTIAKTTSLKGSPNEKPLTLSEALSNLANPAKFVPYFPSLNKLGYEVVSGGTNMLVFKKVRQEKSSASTAKDVPEVSEASTRHMNPIDGTTTQTGNFASPTGFVNHDSILPPSASELEASAAPYSGQIKSGDKVRREEPVFSGSSRTAWPDRYGQGPKYRAKMKSRLRRAARRKRTFRRMVWVGVWTATCCYAVGLVTEHFRASSG